MLSITLTPSPSSVVSGAATDPAGTTVLVPIDGVDTATDASSNPLAIQYGVPTSSNPNVSVSLMPVTNYVDLNLTFTNSSGTKVTGDIVLALFGNSAPNTVAQIVSLVNQGAVQRRDVWIRAGWFRGLRGLQQRRYAASQPG